MIINFGDGIFVSKEMGLKLFVQLYFLFHQVIKWRSRFYYYKVQPTTLTYIVCMMWQPLTLLVLVCALGNVLPGNISYTGTDARSHFPDDTKTPKIKSIHKLETKRYNYHGHDLDFSSYSVNRENDEDFSFFQPGRQTLHSNSIYQPLHPGGRETLHSNSIYQPAGRKTQRSNSIYQPFQQSGRKTQRSNSIHQAFHQPGRQTLHSNSIHQPFVWAPSPRNASTKRNNRQIFKSMYCQFRFLVVLFT